MGDRLGIPGAVDFLRDFSLFFNSSVSIYDLEIAHSTEGPRGVIVLLIETAMAERFQGGLMALGYRPSLQALEA